MDEECRELVETVWKSSEAQISNIFSYSSSSSLDMDRALSCVIPRVSSDENAPLNRPFSRDEIRKVLMDIHPSKAPGLDGSKYFEWAGDVGIWNGTLITLIPKIKELRQVKDFRPISLCNVLYKIISRTCYIALKLDMSKTYDRVEWDFLKGLMNKLGFSLPWTNLVMRCVTSIFYLFLINGQVQGSLSPGRGLQQDDSLIFCRARTRECVELKQCL
ncbi:hypothetical protein UlMin_034905 [Ulmus minor]